MPSLASRPWNALPRAMVVTAAPAPPAAPPLIGFFFDEGAETFAAYEYAGGTIGDLIEQTSVPGIGTVNDACILSFSPLVVAVRDAASVIYTWNVTTNAVVTNADHPDSGFSISSMAYGGNSAGGAYFIESNQFADAYRLYHLTPDGLIAEVVQSDYTTVATVEGVIYGFCFANDVSAFLVVAGNSPGDGNSGNLQILLGGGGRPTFNPSDTAFPGDPVAGDWADWGVGLGNPLLGGGWNETLAWSITRGGLRGVWDFESEPFYDPLPLNPGETVTNLCPDIAAAQYVIYTGERAAMAIPMVSGDPDALVWYEIEAGPGDVKPSYMIPAP